LSTRPLRPVVAVANCCAMRFAIGRPANWSRRQSARPCANRYARQARSFL